ncbi:serine/threonine-protein kinase [Pengzhenrongella frigida]|uniref:non-specific serine/threonine protein kinase n=1 Tax=Pengzhenrongella frigida TaxID=1259133 RepID=A0A4Q5N1N5_9MICO|nr:serine/threonine-protein kinase [Cellulomonas sp. HLT2-17]RYV49931.1 serine/threonine protein kinase [Cellulomonas sp. HLT2-17]
MSDQQTVIDTLFRVLQRFNRWPDWAEADYEFDNVANLLDPWAAVRAVDRRLIWGVGELRPSDEHQVGLTIAGLADCPAAAEDLAAFVEAVRYAAQVAKVAPPKASVTVSAEELRHRIPLPAAGRTDLLARQGAIWQTNGYLWNGFSAGAEPKDWSVTFDRTQLRAMRRIEDVDDYLQVVENATQGTSEFASLPRAGSGPAVAATTSDAPRNEEITTATGVVYTLIWGERLGAGGQGQVYAGVDAHGRPVAIKRVKLQDYTVAIREKDLRYAEREAVINFHLEGGDLRHVLQLLDHAETDRALFLVYPRAAMSLADVVGLVGAHPDARADNLAAARTRYGDNGPERDELRSITVELATGLAELHEHGVLHRDLKPANALWHEDRWVWGDLGIARLVDAITATYTWRDVGTLEYRAPEVTRGERATQRSDVYSLGCTIFATATGHPPFTGEDVVRSHAEVPPDLELIEDLTLRNTISHMLRKSPGARPTAQQVATMMERAPQGPVPDALRRNSLAASLRENRRVAVTERVAARVRAAEDALAQLDLFWDRLTSEVQRAHPSAQDHRGDGAWILATDDRRLVVTTAVPASDECPAVQLGIVIVEAEGSSGPKSTVANLCAIPDGDEAPIWRLMRMVRNDLAIEKVPVSVALSDGRGAVSLHDLEGHFRQRAERVVAKSASAQDDEILTVDRLAALFAAEVAAIDERMERDD